MLFSYIKEKGTIMNNTNDVKKYIDEKIKGMSNEEAYNWIKSGKVSFCKRKFLSFKFHLSSWIREKRNKAVDKSFNRFLGKGDKKGRKMVKKCIKENTKGMSGDQKLEWLKGN